MRAFSSWWNHIGCCVFVVLWKQIRLWNYFLAASGVVNVDTFKVQTYQRPVTYRKGQTSLSLPLHCIFKFKFSFCRAALMLVEVRWGIHGLDQRPPCWSTSMPSFAFVFCIMYLYFVFCISYFVFLYIVFFILYLYFEVRWGMHGLDQCPHCWSASMHSLVFVFYILYLYFVFACCILYVVFCNCILYFVFVF